MRVFGIDPGSIRTGYGCVDSDGTRHRLIVCGAVATPPRAALADRLLAIYDTLMDALAASRPDCVAIESVFHAANVRSALVLGHARGVAVLAARRTGLPVFEYTPAEIKRGLVGYGRAEKVQVQGMVRLLLGLARPPEPFDAADALAVAVCHLHVRALLDRTAPRPEDAAAPKSWRAYRPPRARGVRSA